MKCLSACLLIGLTFAASSSFGTIYFQNDGDNATWPNYPQQPQASGTIGTISSPTFEGPKAIKFTQTYTGYGGRYHTEVDYQNTQTTGDDRYYGLAVYLPANWTYAADEVCIQQWAGTGPWLMMKINNSSIEVLPHITGVQNLGSIPRGQWVSIVSHLKTSTSGVFEIWVNGVQKMSLSGDFTAPEPNGNVRWSAGCYVTGWYPDPGSTPTPSYRELYQDHYRIASTRVEADPSNWDEFSGYYKIVDRNSGKVPAVQGAATTNGAPVVLWSFGSAQNDQWQFVPTDSGFYKLLNRKSGLSMAVKSASTAAGASIIQWSFGAAQNDQWQPVKLGTGFYTLLNRHSGLVLDVAGAGTANGTIFDQWGSNGGNNQQFQIISNP